MYPPQIRESWRMYSAIKWAKIMNTLNFFSSLNELRVGDSYGSDEALGCRKDFVPDSRRQRLKRWMSRA